MHTLKINDKLYACPSLDVFYQCIACTKRRLIAEIHATSSRLQEAQQPDSEDIDRLILFGTVLHWIEDRSFNDEFDLLYSD